MRSTFEDGKSFTSSRVRCLCHLRILSSRLIVRDNTRVMPMAESAIEVETHVIRTPCEFGIATPLWLSCVFKWNRSGLDTCFPDDSLDDANRSYLGSIWLA